VSQVGLAHGLLFVVFCFALFDARNKEGWTIRQVLVPFVASLLPFGPFVIDGRLKNGLR
jgi:integral membrane protein